MNPPVHKYNSARYVVCTHGPLVATMILGHGFTRFWKHVTCQACFDVGLSWGIQETTQRINEVFGRRPIGFTPDRFE